MVGYLVSLDSSEQLSSETQSISNNRTRVNVAIKHGLKKSQPRKKDTDYLSLKSAFCGKNKSYLSTYVFPENIGPKMTFRISHKTKG